MAPKENSKRGRLELRLWDYGIGEEGIKPAPGTLELVNAVIVDRAFPWWYGPARSVDFKVTNIWLTNYELVDRIGTELMCGTEVIIEVSSEPSEAFIKAFKRADVILISGKIPSVLEHKGLWTTSPGVCLKAVIYTEPSRHRPGRPWRTDVSKIVHSEVGGITDGCFNVLSNLKAPKSSDDGNIETGDHVQQDLRWVLKSSEPGRVTREPSSVGRLKRHQSNVIHESSLLPWNNMDTEVVTKYRHNQWVVRSLTTLERLLTLDVSEHLIKSIPNAEDQLMLLASITVPVKVLQSAVEHFSRILRRHPGAIEIASETLGKRKWDQIMNEPTMDEGKVIQNDHKASALTLMREVGRRIGTDDNEVSGVLDMMTRTTHILSEVDTGVIEEDVNAVATKSDDAEVRIKLWNDRLIGGLSEPVASRDVLGAANVLRKYVLKFWKRSVISSFENWVESQEAQRTPVSEETKAAGIECCKRASRSSWWNWDGGSRPFFWRWPKTYQSIVLEGVPAWFESSVDKWTRRQRKPKDIHTAQLMSDKLTIIRSKGYVEAGQIYSLMSFFEVPKGKNDIRMVYDGTKSGLNDSLWAPWFPLPTVECLIRSLEPGYFMADNDVGEMFHNFVLHKELRKFCGLDMTSFFTGQPGAIQSNGKLWERWNRLAMGLRNSPYNAVQGMMVIKEVILGDPLDDTNVFRWKSIRLNLPGSERYDPSKSWIAKIREDDTVAADIFIYVDDIRTCAPSEADAWKAAQRTSTVLGFLGIQDAARKRRQPSQEAGAWTGSVVWTSNGTVVALTTQEKWDKTRVQVRWIADNMKDPNGLDNKKLKSIRGFLVYVSRTYNSMVPYLKGIHATIDSWRPGRNVDGWKYTEQKKWFDDLDPMEYEFGIKPDTNDEPAFVFPVPRLAGDIRCLLELTSFINPPHRKIRMSRGGQVMYGFGDASKQGFGASVELADKSIMWRSGEFSSIVQEQSSNYRELLNLVVYIESIYKKGLLDDCELFMFTDNSTAEAAYFKGTSKSELLFDLVLRLRKIEMEGKCILHMIHVAGTRMIWQGTDGLSRGDRHAGIMSGESMMSFLPLHLSADQRSTDIIPWIKTWANLAPSPGGSLNILTIDDWYKPITTNDIYLWLPPPAAADVAVEMMSQSIHKRPYATHIFLCPRLMTSRWMRLLLKATDVTWRIPTGSTIWNVANHEPLVFSIYFSLNRNKPWRHSRCAQFGHETKLVQAMLSRCTQESGVALRKLLIRTRKLASL